MESSGWANGTKFFIQKDTMPTQLDHTRHLRNHSSGSSVNWRDDGLAPIITTIYFWSLVVLAAVTFGAVGTILFWGVFDKVVIELLEWAKFIK